MDIDTLYKQYGQLLIQLEIIQGKIQECKKNIVTEMNKPKPKPEKDEK